MMESADTRTAGNGKKQDQAIKPIVLNIDTSPHSTHLQRSPSLRFPNTHASRSPSRSSAQPFLGLLRPFPRLLLVLHPWADVLHQRAKSLVRSRRRGRTHCLGLGVSGAERFGMPWRSGQAVGILWVGRAACCASLRTDFEGRTPGGL